MKPDFSIVNRKEVSPKDRIDPEFFRKLHRQLEEKLQKIPHKKFSEVCQESKARINPTKNTNNYFKYLEITDLNLLDGSFYPQHVLGEQAPSRARKLCEKQNLIVSTVRPNRNAVAIIDGINSGKLVCSTGFCVFKAVSNIPPEVVFIFLKTKYAIEQLTRRMRATMYPAVANIDIFELIVPLISENLQSKIISELKKTFELRKEVYKLLEYIDSKVGKFTDNVLSNFDIDKYDHNNNIKILRKSEVISDHNRMDAEFYRELFNKLDNQLHKYGKFERLGNFYNRIFTGNTPGKAQYREPEESDFAIIKVGTLTNIGLNWSGVEFISEEYFNKNKKSQIKENDILFTSSAHSAEHICKKVDVVRNIPKEYENKCIFVGEVMTLRNDKKSVIEPYYIASFLRSKLGKVQVQRCTRGISSHIYDVDIKKYVKVPLPDENLMNKISMAAQKAEEKRNAAIDKVRSLISEYECEIGI